MAAFAVTLVTIPLVFAAAVLFTLPSREGSAGRAASASRSPAASASAPATQLATTTPSATASPTLTPAATPPASPSATPVVETVRVGLTQRATINVGGQAVGTMRVAGFKHTTVNGNLLLAIKVRFEAADVPMTYSSDGWTARSENGDVYQRAAENVQPQLGEGTLDPGEKATGFLAFDVPRRGIGRYIDYRPEGASTIVEVDLFELVR